MIHKSQYIIEAKRIIPFNISYELIDYSDKLTYLKIRKN